MPSLSPTPNDLTRQQLDELDALLQRMLSLPLSGPNEPVPVEKPFTPPPLPDVPQMPAGQWRRDRPNIAPKMSHLVESPVRAPSLVAVSAEASRVVDESPDEETEAFPSPTPTWDPDPIVRRSMEARIEPEPQDSADEPPPAVLPLRETIVETPSNTVTLRGVDAPALPFGFRSPFAEEKDFPVTPPSDTPVFAPLPIPQPVSTVVSAPSVPVLLWPLFAMNWILESTLRLCGPSGLAMTRPVPKTLLGVLGFALILAAGTWSARGLGWITFPLPR